jgi:hypothetical protein
MDDRHFNTFIIATQKRRRRRDTTSREKGEKKRKERNLNLSLVVARFECVECIVTFLLLFTTDTRDAIQHMIDSKRDKVLSKKKCVLSIS